MYKRLTILTAFGLAALLGLSAKVDSSPLGVHQKADSAASDLLTCRRDRDTNGPITCKALNKSVASIIESLGTPSEEDERYLVYKSLGIDLIIDRTNERSGKVFSVVFYVGKEPDKLTGYLEGIGVRAGMSVGECKRIIKSQKTVLVPFPDANGVMHERTYLYGFQGRNIASFDEDGRMIYFQVNKDVPKPGF